MQVALRSDLGCSSLHLPHHLPSGSSPRKQGDFVKERGESTEVLGAASVEQFAGAPVAILSQNRVPSESRWGRRAR
jgi:hypothetical protein